MSLRSSGVITAKKKISFYCFSIRKLNRSQLFWCGMKQSFDEPIDEPIDESNNEPIGQHFVKLLQKNWVMGLLTKLFINNYNFHFCFNS